MGNYSNNSRIHNNYTTIGTNATAVNISNTNTKGKSRLDYTFIYQIGSGGFGRVWKVLDKRTKAIYAMK